MNASYKTRSGIIFLGFCCVYGVIILNLYRLQIRNHQFFTQLGKKQYSGTITTHPPRAPIIDRAGTLLALNKDSLAAFIVPNNLKNPAQTASFLKNHFPAAWQRLHAHPHAHFMYVGRRLTSTQQQLIQDAQIADIHFLHEPHRYYPTSSSAQVIGITDIDNKGLFGLELYFNDQLSGKPTTYFLERDARSGHFYFQRHTHTQGKEGTPIQVTLDSKLQFLAHEELKKTIAHYDAKQGAVLVINPQNGEIVVMTCWPTFDPNNTKAIDLATAKNIIATEEYELGSVIKTFSGLASLAARVVTIDELIDCEQTKTTYVDGRKINTVPSSVAGIIPFWQVIAKSNNIGIAKVVKRLGPQLYDHYLRLGFGKKTNIQFPGERSGFINHPDNWSKQSLFSLSYGYEITATLLQLGHAFCIIANKGYDIPLTLLTNEKKQMSAAPLYDAQTMHDLQLVLETTVQQGSAKKAQMAGYKVMSKTGTANILMDGQYSKTHNIYTCAGIVEKGNYQRVIVTFIKEVKQQGLYASMVAVPLLQKVAEKILIHDKVL